jgi:hypothetical protein
VPAGPVRAICHHVSFGIYLFGIILVIAGLVYAASILHVATHWIVVLALLMLGGGVIAAVKSTRTRDPSS